MRRCVQVSTPRKRWCANRHHSSGAQDGREVEREDEAIGVEKQCRRHKVKDRDVGGGEGSNNSPYPI